MAEPYATSELKHFGEKDNFGDNLNTNLEETGNGRRKGEGETTLGQDGWKRKCKGHLEKIFELMKLLLCFRKDIFLVFLQSALRFCQSAGSP